MSAALKLILIALGFASAFLLIGLLLRSKIKVLQKLFLPASVIGGIVGLILVQIFSRVSGVSQQVASWVSVMDALPAILGVLMPILIGKMNAFGILLFSLAMAVVFTTGAVVVGILRGKRLANVNA